jgi:hypothetical protein
MNMKKTVVRGLFALLVVAVFAAVLPAQANARISTASATEHEITCSARGNIDNIVGFRVHPRGESPFVIFAPQQRTYTMPVTFDPAGTRVSVARNVCNAKGRCKIRFSRPVTVTVIETPEGTEEHHNINALTLTEREDGMLDALAISDRDGTYAAVQVSYDEHTWVTAFPVPASVDGTPVVVASVPGATMRIVELNYAGDIVRVGTIIAASK